ncbi:MAG: hypothetical protein IPP93_07385 [Chitinophagaceae bacterium]|nr:hypothetical protein [Chitinophagaceae bacterium]
MPRFTVKDMGQNRIVLGWVNAYPVVKQISIQRSLDSLTGFKSILTVPDPGSLQNGYLDTKAGTNRSFYRLYILLENGVYLFSNTKRPQKDSFLMKPGSSNQNGRTNPADSIQNLNNPMMLPSWVHGNMNNLPAGKLNPVDSISGPTRIQKPPAFLPSLHVFTSNDGNVTVKLPENEKLKDYSIKFFDEKNQFLFELKDMKSRTFKVDKASFLHAGWFFFEMYDEGKQIEKYKFYLESDF